MLGNFRALDALAGLALVCMTILLAIGLDGEIKTVFIGLVGYIIRAAIPLVTSANGK